MNTLINNISMVSSVLQKPPETFLPKVAVEGARRQIYSIFDVNKRFRYVEEVEEDLEARPEGEEAKKEESPGRTSKPVEKEKRKEEAKTEKQPVSAPSHSDDIDLLGLSDFSSTPVQPATTVQHEAKKTSVAPVVNATDNLLDLDLLGGGHAAPSGTAATTSHTSQPQGGYDLDFFGSSPAVENPTAVPYEVAIFIS